MELSYKELAKRDVINIVDGRCLGRICDLKLDFPKGTLSGIVVPGKKTGWFLRCFDKNNIYIDQSKIIKIGGDVILVNLRCGEVCSPSLEVNEGKRQQRPPAQPCPPACNPTCPPNLPNCEDLLKGTNGRIDLSDY